MHGTMREILANHKNDRPLLLYLSGDDAISREFETKVLTKDGIIMLMVSLTKFSFLLMNYEL